MNDPIILKDLPLSSDLEKMFLEKTDLSNVFQVVSEVPAVQDPNVIYLVKRPS